MSIVEVAAHNAAITPQPEATPAELRAAVDELITALNRRTAQLRCLIRAARPVLQTLEAIAFNDDPIAEDTREAIRECAELREVLAVAELVK